MNATVDETLLNSGAPCQPVVYWIRETPGDKGLARTLIPLTITSVTAARITGTVDVPANAQLGAYALKVFIGDKARTLANALTIIAT